MNDIANDSPIKKTSDVKTLPDSTIINNESEKIGMAPPDESPSEIKAAFLLEWSEMCKNVTEIRDLIAERLKYDKTKEHAFERLYEELDAHKKNKEFENNRPLYIDLILLYDRIQLSKKEHDDSNCDVLDSIQDELMEILLRRDIEIIKKEGGSFDPCFQRIVNTQEVTTIDLDGEVIHILRDGFTSKGGILRPQEVVVGKYLSSPKDTELNEKSENQ